MTVFRSIARLLLIGACFISIAMPVHAADYSGSNFIIRDPVIGGLGGYGTSSSYQLFSSGEFTFTGRASASSFLSTFGFLHFPFVTQPSLSATEGNMTVDLSWSASTAGKGFTVSGYEYGIATNPNGPYTFFNVGNVTSTTITGLTNFTTYYFIVRTLDAYGAPIITSPRVSATPTDGTTPPTPGGGSVTTGSYMGVRFTGAAYPQAVVSVLKNGVVRATVTAGASGLFSLALHELYDRTVLYSLYAEDTDKRRSLLLNYPLIGQESRVTEVSGIKFAPTLGVDKVMARAGDPVLVSGFALPNQTISFEIDGLTQRAVTVVSDGGGRYQLSIATEGLSKGSYQIRAHYPGDPRYSLTVQFTVGDMTILPAPPRGALAGDCNADHEITLTDFSVLAYWYEKPNPPACIDMNTDGKIDLVDFSILAYYWNG